MAVVRQKRPAGETARQQHGGVRATHAMVRVSVRGRLRLRLLLLQPDCNAERGAAGSTLLFGKLVAGDKLQHCNRALCLRSVFAADDAECRRIALDLRFADRADVIGDDGRDRRCHERDQGYRRLHNPNADTDSGPASGKRDGLEDSDHEGRDLRHGDRERGEKAGLGAH